MPNWCYTNYKLVGEAAEIADLHKKLTELETMAEPLVENGFGNLFLGCVVNHFGGDWNKIYCRGEIEYMERCSDNLLHITTSTAWGDMPEVWDFVCEQYPGITYYFLAEEGGMCYYVNSDTTGEYFPEKYLIDDFANGSDYAESDEELFAIIAERIEVDRIENFEELNIYLELFNEDHPDDGIYYHEFTKPKSQQV